ncbi:hypothetical protein DL96DRAFT_738473 [Flagelloscypha sp. PMI_526]|nr:hypothetical protein DL96DRAFT_738473 [Flagelloscypha sp. PMI_526]
MPGYSQFTRHQSSMQIYRLAAEQHVGGYWRIQPSSDGPLRNGDCFGFIVGTGKTVMSSFIIETLQKQDDIHVAYYYFEFTSPAALSEVALYHSLIAQLAAASPGTVRSFYQKHNNGGLQPQLSTLRTTLNELVTASSKPVFIVIDALDEFSVAQRKCLLESLITFCRLDSASRTHLMTTSREELDIQREFEGVDFELGVQGDLVRQDIAVFVDRQLAAQKWMFWPRDDIEMMRRSLNKRADGQFRMVACQMDILQRVKSFNQLRESFHSLPKSLVETYNYILERIPGELRVQAHRLFAILSFAFSPISIHELSALIAVDFGNEQDVDDDIPVFREKNRFHDPLDILELGTSLVSRVESKARGIHLQLAHASVKEHFLGSRWDWFSLHQDLTHSIIARSCLALLSHFRILQHIHPVYNPYTYSTNYWYRHVLPNGPMQLSRQQQFLYASFPWPCLSTTILSLYRYLRTNSPIASAASFGLFDLLKTFLNARMWSPDLLAGALVEAARSLQPCLISLQCCILLITHNANINALANHSFPLQSASSCGHLEIVQFLVEKGAEVNAVGGEHGTALQAAARYGSLETVRFLIEKGAEVNALGGKNWTALHAAATRGCLEIVKLLLEKGADVNVVGGEDGTALQASARHGSLDVARFLVEKGADVNAVGGEYGTALHGSAYWGSLEIVRFLVEKGAEAQIISEKHGTALDAATNSRWRSDEVVSYLTAYRDLKDKIRQ